MERILFDELKSVDNNLFKLRDDKKDSNVPLKEILSEIERFNKDYKEYSQKQRGTARQELSPEEHQLICRIIEALPMFKKSANINERVDSIVIGLFWQTVTTFENNMKRLKELKRGERAAGIDYDSL